MLEETSRALQSCMQVFDAIPGKCLSVCLASDCSMFDDSIISRKYFFPSLPGMPPLRADQTNRKSGAFLLRSEETVEVWTAASEECSTCGQFRRTTCGFMMMAR